MFSRLFRSRLQEARQTFPARVRPRLRTTTSTTSAPAPKHPVVMQNGQQVQLTPESRKEAEALVARTNAENLRKAEQDAYINETVYERYLRKEEEKYARANGGLKGMDFWSDSCGGSSCCTNMMADVKPNANPIDDDPAQAMIDSGTSPAPEFAAPQAQAASSGDLMSFLGVSAVLGGLWYALSNSDNKKKASPLSGTPTRKKRSSPKGKATTKPLKFTL